jgi:PAS domain S-box-containing protein
MRSLPELLEAWRAAERRWERHAPPDEVRAAALDVVAAWSAYQDAALPPDTREFTLVADDDGRYVHATSGVSRILGYEPSDLMGLGVVDLAASEVQAATASQWADFLAAGRQEGRFQLRAKDGRVVRVAYQARAHHPVPGYHSSRLWPDDDSVTDEAPTRGRAGP